MSHAMRLLRDPLCFYREEIYLDNGSRFGDVAAPWQIDLLRRIEEGTRFAWIEAPRGFAKTSMLAMVALKRLILGAPGQRVYAAAGDRDQARLLSDELAGFVRRNSRLADGLSLGMYRTTLEEKGSIFEVLAADAPSSWGLKPDLCLIDEVTTWRRRELFDSLYSATGKKSGAQLLGISNAGLPETWQWDLREAVRQDPDWFFLHLEPGQAPWISEKWIEQQRRILPPGVFARVIENQWVASEGGFVDPEDVDACAVDPADFHPEEARKAMLHVALGVDIGLRHDATALAVVGIDERGLVTVLDLRVFAPVAGEEIRLDLVETRARELVAKWGVHGTAVDPWQGIGLLQRAGPALRAEEFTFSGTHVQELTGFLYEKVSRRQMRFSRDAGRAVQSGDEWTLARELRGAVVKQTSYGFRLDHDSTGYSDRIMAVGMALHWLSKRPLVTPRIYWI